MLAHGGRGLVLSALCGAVACCATRQVAEQSSAWPSFCTFISAFSAPLAVVVVVGGVSPPDAIDQFLFRPWDRTSTADGYADVTLRGNGI
jgi:hypothetical protein